LAARLLRAHGFRLVVEPESFLVTKQDRLRPEETVRVRAWAAGLGGRVAPGRAASTQR
jgi:hypothetical protein